MEYTFADFPRISVNQSVATGKPCVAGTRITVSALLSYFAEGMSEKQILKEFPKLKSEDIKQALAYASAMMLEKIIPLKN